MLFIIFKGTNKNCSIWILDATTSMHIVVLEFTLINRTIRVIFCSSYDFMIFKFSFVHSLAFFLMWFCIIENISSFSMELSVFNLSSICFNSLFVNSFSSSLSVFEVAFVRAFSKVPFKIALAMHGVHVPLSVVERSFMNLCKASISMSFSVSPLTLVNISIWVSKSTYSIIFLVSGLALIVSTI